MWLPYKLISFVPLVSLLKFPVCLLSLSHYFWLLSPPLQSNQGQSRSGRTASPSRCSFFSSSTSTVQLSTSPSFWEGENVWKCKFWISNSYNQCMITRKSISYKCNKICWAKNEDRNNNKEKTIETAGYLRWQDCKILPFISTDNKVATLHYFKICFLLWLTDLQAGLVHIYASSIAGNWKKWVITLLFHGGITAKHYGSSYF